MKQPLLCPKKPKTQTGQSTNKNCSLRIPGFPRLSAICSCRFRVNWAIETYVIGPLSHLVFYLVSERSFAEGRVGGERESREQVLVLPRSALWIFIWLTVPLRICHRSRSICLGRSSHDLITRASNMPDRRYVFSR